MAVLIKFDQNSHDQYHMGKLCFSSADWLVRDGIASNIHEQPIRQNRLSRVKFSTFFRCIKEINYLRYRLKQLFTSTPVKDCYLFSITEHYPQMQSTIEQAVKNVPITINILKMENWETKSYQTFKLGVKKPIGLELLPLGKTRQCFQTLITIV